MTSTSLGSAMPSSKMHDCEHFLIRNVRLVNSLYLPVVLGQEHWVLAYFLPSQLPMVPRGS